MKISTRLLTTSIIILAAQYGAAMATPQETGIGSGVKSITHVGTDTNVVLKSNSARQAWSSIDTNSNEGLNFFVLGSNSVIINEVTGGVTNFAGSMKSILPNGQIGGHVVIRNSDGAIFAGGSQVNVGSLVVSAAGAVSAPNANGVSTFSDFSSNGKVVLDGTINTPASGYVNALANEVTVGADGQINTSGGNVNLAAGSKSYTVDLNGDGKVTYSTANLDSGAVTVLGDIEGGNGQVAIQARANDITSGVINLNGVIDISGGKLTTNSTGDTNLQGSIYASGDTTNGGTVNINAKGNIDNQADIEADSNTGKAGSITIAAGGDLSNSGEIGTGVSAKAASVKLSGNNVDIGGDITAGDVSVTASGNLNTTNSINSSGDVTLHADKNITTVDDNGVSNSDIDLEGATTGGKLTISSGGDLDMNSIIENHSAKGGGNISITSGGALHLAGYISSDADAGNSAGVTIVSANDALIESNIFSSAVSNTGDVSITSKTGSVDVESLIDTSMAKNGGNVSIVAANNITLNADNTPDALVGITTGGDASAGNINLNAKTGTLTLNANADASDENTTGNLTLNGGGGVVINGDISTASDSKKGGNITITSGGSTLLEGYVDSSAVGSDSGLSSGGNITVTSAGDLTVDNSLVSDGDNGAGNITVTSKGMYTNTANGFYSAIAGNKSGNITLTAADAPNGLPGFVSSTYNNITNSAYNTHGVQGWVKIKTPGATLAAKPIN